MAGIGFELKKLFDKKSALGYFRAYTYTTIVTTGPFIMMVAMVLSIQLLLFYFDAPYNITQLYIASVVYPFIFSHMASSGFAMLITRFAADKLYSKEYGDVISALYGMLALALVAGSVLAIAFFWNKPLAMELKIITYILYMGLIVIWIQGVFLTALKDYQKIIKSYFVGAVIAVLLAYAVLKTAILPLMFGIILAISIGVLIIAALLIVNIQKFFTVSSFRPFLFLSYLETHFKLFLVSLFYTISLYIPNMIMWHGPLGVMIADTYVYAPIYDVATFYAFLSILPVMIVFLVSTELNFYSKYSAYFTYITEKGNLKEIDDARNDLLRVMWSEISNIVEIQLVFTLIFLAIGNYLLPKIGLAHASVNMYNLIVLGAYAIGIMQVVLTILLYLEDRKGALVVAVSFLIFNVCFNLISLNLGEKTYGFGFFLAAILGLVVSLRRLALFSKKIDYYVFCSLPVFSSMKTGIFSKIVQKLYG